MSTCQNLQHQHPLKPSHLLPFTMAHYSKARPGGWPGESTQWPGLGRLHRDQLHGLRPWQPQGLRPLGYIGGRWMELEGGVVFAKRSDGFWGAWDPWEGCHHGEVTETENHGTSKIAGWWFGTFFIFHNIWVVILPIDFHIFQRGRYTTNQIATKSPNSS